MGIAAIVLLLVAGIFAWMWDRERQHTKYMVNLYDHDTKQLVTSNEESARREAELEAEIVRLRKQPLTPEPKRVDNSVIKATSPAHVRQLTEAAWGLKPQIEGNDEPE